MPGRPSRSHVGFTNRRALSLDGPLLAANLVGQGRDRTGLHTRAVAGRSRGTASPRVAPTWRQARGSQGPGAANANDAPGQLRDAWAPTRPRAL